MAKLRAQWIAFAEYYLQLWNGTDAAIAAGYSPKTARQQASRLLTRVDIQAYIQERLGRAAMEADEVLERLGEQARSDLGRFMGLSVDELKAHPQSHLIKKFERIVITDKDGGTQERIKIELYDGQTALLNIGKHHKLFTDNVDVTSGGKPLVPAVESMKDLFQMMGQREKTSNLTPRPLSGADALGEGEKKQKTGDKGDGSDEAR